MKFHVSWHTLHPSGLVRSLYRSRFDGHITRGRNAGESWGLSGGWRLRRNTGLVLLNPVSFCRACRLDSINSGRHSLEPNPWAAGGRGS